MISSWVVRRGSGLVEVAANASTTDFVFGASFNVPNLHYLEDRPDPLLSGRRSAPTDFEQRDALAAVHRLGGLVVRIYTLSFQSNLSAPLYHVASQTDRNSSWSPVPGSADPPLYFNNDLLDGLDRAVAAAADFGVRLIVPFIDRWQWWGGIPAFAQMHNLSAQDDFFSDSRARANFLAVATAVVNRTNPYTGKRYCEDPAIMVWETGNELETTTGKPTPGDWTITVAQAIRDVLRTAPVDLFPAGVEPGHQQLIMDGSYATATGWDASVLASDDIDMLSGHYYSWPSADIPTTDVKITISAALLAVCLAIALTALCSLILDCVGCCGRPFARSKKAVPVSGSENPSVPSSSRRDNLVNSGQKPPGIERQSKTRRMRRTILAVVLALFTLASAGFLAWLITARDSLSRSQAGPHIVLLQRDLAEAAAAGKPLLAGEFGLTALSNIRGVLDTAAAAAPACPGALIWSLRFRARDGGFYTHSEGNGYYAYHYPGFSGAGTGFGADEPDIVPLIAQYAARPSPLAVPPLTTPSPAPVILVGSNSTTTTTTTTTSSVAKTTSSTSTSNSTASASSSSTAAARLRRDVPASEASSASAGEPSSSPTLDATAESTSSLPSFSESSGSSTASVSPDTSASASDHGSSTIASSSAATSFSKSQESTSTPSTTVSSTSFSTQSSSSSSELSSELSSTSSSSSESSFSPSSSSSLPGTSTTSEAPPPTSGTSTGSSSSLVLSSSEFPESTSALSSSASSSPYTTSTATTTTSTRSSSSSSSVATATAAAGVAVRWRGSTGATAYRVERSLQGTDGPWTVVEPAATDAVAYSAVETAGALLRDTGLPDGAVQAWYRVTPFNDAGDGPASEPVQLV
ncbi:hypothetical protein HK405_001666 [Cladochytrium tenue]|nr:hypothetical protein HK405_001666 [Cladochytrium tenue]